MPSVTASETARRSPGRSLHGRGSRIGLPVALLRGGLTAQGLPMGLQVVGPKFAVPSWKPLSAIAAPVGFGHERAMAGLRGGWLPSPSTKVPCHQRFG